MTSIFEALAQLFTRWGIGLRYIQWCVAGVLGGYVGLAVLSVFLSSWGLQWLIWIFVAFYVFGVINLMASPFLWGGVAAAAYARGQVGGEEGLSAKDGIDTVRDWGGKALSKSAKFLLFYGAVPFIWTALFQTKGWEEENLVALILLPTVIYFALVRWPDSQSIFNTIGYVLIAVVLVGVLGTIYNTIQHKVADPAAQVAMEHEDKEAATKRENDLAVAQYIYGKLARKVPLTPDEEVILARLEKEKVEQSLRPKDLKTNVERFVGEAKPTDSAWWKAYWPWIGAIVIALVIAYRYGLFGRTTNQVVVVTPATMGTAATVVTTPVTSASGKKSAEWFWKFALLALIVGLVYAWHTDRIFYQKTVTLEKTDLRNFEICGISPGTRTWKPARRAIVALTQKMPGGSEVIVNQKYEITLFLLMNDTVAGEPFQVKEGECVKGSFDLSKDARQDIRFLPQHIALTFYSALW